MGIEEQFGEIVIKRVLEKSLPSQLLKLMVSTHFQINPYLIPYQNSLGRGVYLKESNEELTADIYLYLEYCVKVPKVALAIQKAVKDAVRDIDELSAVNIHVAGTVPDKTPKPELKDLFNE